MERHQAEVLQSDGFESGAETGGLTNTLSLVESAACCFSLVIHSQ